MAVEFRGLAGSQRGWTRKRESRSHLGFVPVLDIDTDAPAGGPLLAKYLRIGGARRQVDTLASLEDAFHLQVLNQTLDGIDTVMAKAVTLLCVAGSNLLR